MNRNIILAFFILAFSIGCQQSSTAGKVGLPDTPDNRTKLAARYFELVPMRQMMKDVGEEMAARMPEETKEHFLTYWKTFVTEEQVREIESVAASSMAKHMTTSELEAFIEFMEKPEGQSAMGKMKYYMVDIMPLIQRRSMEAIQKYQSSN